MRRFAFVTFLALLTTGADAAPDRPLRYRVSPADVVASYQRFERTCRARPPSPEDRPRVNRAFARATMAFFRGGLIDVARHLDGIAASLRPTAQNSLERRIAETIRVRFDPPVIVAGSDAVPTARVVSLYPVEVPSGERPALTLRFRTPAGGLLAVGLDVSAGKIDRIAPLDPVGKRATPGVYDAEIVLPDGTVLVAGRWFVAERSLDERRAENSARLVAATMSGPALEDAREIASSRNSLLRDRPSTTRLIDLVTDPVRLAAEVDVEIAAILDGRDPYANRPGHLWRVLSVGRLRVPMRIYVPTAVAAGTPMPVVIALHGAGVDENVFPEAYGGGEIVRLAERHGFVMVSPSTTRFVSSPRVLPTLLDVLELHLRIDRSRVHVVGHSMGAMAATALAQSQSDRLASAAAMAGGGSVSGKSMVPTLFVAGEIDPIIPAPRVRAAYDAARKAGHPVEFRLAEGYGHTLLVGDLLPDVIEWLLAHRREPEGKGD